MITRRTGYLTVSSDRCPTPARELEREGYTILAAGLRRGRGGRARGRHRPGVRRVAPRHPRQEPAPRALRPVPLRDGQPQRPLPGGHRPPAILYVIEPLLGEDCHVIANTAWRQAAGDHDHGGRFWHIDSGPHVPRPAGRALGRRASPTRCSCVAAHLIVRDCPLEAGPTGVIPRSHTSGQAPPDCEDDDLTCDGRVPCPWWPQPATWPCSCRTRGTGGCRPGPATRAATSCSATTAGATWPPGCA